MACSAESGSPRWPIIVILVLALTVRLAWGLTRPTDAESIQNLPDQREYLELGRSLLHDGRLAMNEPRFNEVVYAFRMPGYPALIAGSGGSVVATRVVQAVLDTSTLLATFWLARRWLSTRLSWLAMALVAVNPFYIYFSGLLLSETLFASMFIWGLAWLIHGTSPMVQAPLRKRACWCVGVGLLLGSIYVRPSALPFPLVLVAAALLVERSRVAGNAVKSVGVMVLVAIATVVVLLPWAIRNRVVVGKFLFTTTNDGFTLYDGLNPEADGSSDQSWIKRMPSLAHLTEVQRSEYLRKEAIAFAKAHPWEAMKLVPRKIARTWSPVPLSAEYGSKRLYVLGAAAYAVPLFMLSIAGLFNRRVPRSARMFLIMPAVLITLMHALSVGSLRYRMPAEAPLAILASSAFVGRGTRERAVR